MSTETRKDLRFYSCLIIAAGLLITSLLLPPVGLIAESVIYSSIVLLGTGALIEGVDIKGIIEAITELKKVSLLDKDDKK